MLGLPDSVYEKYEKCTTSVVCVVLPLHHRREARVSGIRAVDHAEILLRKNKYMVLLVLAAQNSLSNKETIQALRLWTDEHNCLPKAIVGDEAFFQENFLTYYGTHGIKECPCGSRTPWPN